MTLNTIALGGYHCTAVIGPNDDPPTQPPYNTAWIREAELAAGTTQELLAAVVKFMAGREDVAMADGLCLWPLGAGDSTRVLVPDQSPGAKRGENFHDSRPIQVNTGVSSMAWGRRMGLAMLRLLASPEGRKILGASMSMQSGRQIDIRPHYSLAFDENLSRPPRRQDWRRLTPTELPIITLGPAIKPGTPPDTEYRLGPDGKALGERGPGGNVTIFVDVRLDDVSFRAMEIGLGRKLGSRREQSAWDAVERDAGREAKVPDYAKYYAVSQPLHLLLGHELIHAVRMRAGAQDPRPLPGKHTALRARLLDALGVGNVEEALVTYGPDEVRAVLGADLSLDLSEHALISTELRLRKAFYSGLGSPPMRFYSALIQTTWDTSPWRPGIPEPRKEGSCPKA